MLSDPKNEWWPDPSTLIFGKSAVDSKPTDDVFSHLDQKPRKESSGTAASCGDRPDQSPANLPFLGLGGSWYFYKQFYPAHGLCQLPVAKVPEIGIQAGSTLVVPLVIHHDPAKALAVALAVNAPANWKVQEPSGQFLLPAEESTSLVVHIDTPKLSAAELKNAAPQDVRVSAQAEGKSVGEVILHVVLKSSALPQ